MLSFMDITGFTWSIKWSDLDVEENEGAWQGRQGAESDGDRWRKVDEEEGEVRTDLAATVIDREIEARQAIAGEKVVEWERGENWRRDRVEGIWRRRVQCLQSKENIYAPPNVENNLGPKCR